MYTRIPHTVSIFKFTDIPRMKVLNELRWRSFSPATAKRPALLNSNLGIQLIIFVYQTCIYIYIYIYY